MAPLNILIGGEFFRTMREENRYYVDKTGLIEEMLSENQPLVSLVTRPRRFGKTLTMTMLQEFFDIRKSIQDIFEGLAVSKNAALCEAWMNKYPVLFLTLKGVEGQDCDSALSLFRELAVRLCSDNSYLVESRKVTR